MKTLLQLFIPSAVNKGLSPQANWATHSANSRWTVRHPKVRVLSDRDVEAVFCSGLVYL